MTADTPKHLLIGIHTMFWPRQPGVKSWHISFHSIFSPLFRTFRWVQTVKWWIDSCGIGGEQQASISEWRRGVFTELPSLHLASPQPRLGRQLQVSAYWVWQRENWLSAAIVSLRTIMEQAYMHTDTCSSHFLAYSVSHCSSRSLFSSERPASMCETDRWDAQRGREPAAGLYCALIVPKPSKCQWCLQGMPAVCVCLFSACLRGFMSLHVHVCIECFPSRPRVTPCCDPASLPQWDASHCCCWLKTLCLCMRLCLCTLSA